MACLRLVAADAWVPLVLDGSAKARIVLGAHASEVEKFAAAELQHYMAAMTMDGTVLSATTTDAAVQGRISCEIVIGRPETNERAAQVCAEHHIVLDEAALGEDGYVARSFRRTDGTLTLLMTGRQDRSPSFAVYAFLEQMGVRFHGYRERGGEIVPLYVSLNIPLPDITEKPVMRYRFVSDNNFSAADKPKLTAIADWAAKNRCNAFMLTPSRPGESWDQIALHEVRKRGLMVAGPGHVLAKFTPDKTLFEAHPEYFPLIKGKRSAAYSETWGGVTSFCWSNEEAMRLVVANAVKHLDASPKIDVFAVYPPDGSQRGSQCQCGQCAKMPVSDWYLTLINRIAEATADRRQKVMWIAYNECGVPPVQVKPWQQGRNMVLLWCNDLRVFNAPMDSEANRHAAPYLEWKPRLKTIKTDGAKSPGDADLAAFLRWQRWKQFLKASDFAGDVVMLDYYNQHVGNSLKVPMLQHLQSGPWPNGIMPKDFQFYAGQGISGWQNCTDYYNDVPTPYWNWLAAQLMWNPKADVAALDNDFYAQMYGAAGTAMQGYFNGLWHAMGTEPARYDGLEGMLGEAEATAGKAGNSVITDRIHAVRQFHHRLIAPSPEKP